MPTAAATGTTSGRCGSDLEPAGGADKNKRAVAALTLDPGTYRLSYQTDGSHDCESGFNADGPDDSLWGARLYALDASVDVATLNVRQEAPLPAPTAGGALALPPADRLLARIDSVGDDEDRRVRFTLDAPADVRIVAQGELADDRRFDYATLERTDGEPVWDMTWENTVPGGEAFYHRRFDGTVALAAGSYVLRYESDDSRSFGEFGPASETLWGVHVYGPEPRDRPPDVPPPPPPPPSDV